MNYQKELEQLLSKLSQEEYIPSLLLHSCCAPCSSYVLEYLSDYFRITVFFYNPNIYPESEYIRRIADQQALIPVLNEVEINSSVPHLKRVVNTRHPISFLAGRYEPDEFYNRTRGIEQVGEGGPRCIRCYQMRLDEAARVAEEGEFDYFATTLSISPMKHAATINQIGEEIAKQMGVKYLLSDFKKRNGYQRSIELSRQYDLYRQNYCGCEFSLPRKKEEQ